MSATNLVGRQIVELVANLARSSHYPLADLAAGVVEARALESSSPISWDAFVQLLDRLETTLGPARLDELLGDLPHLAPMASRLLGNFVSPRTLHRFVNRLQAPTMYPMLRSRYEELEEGDETLVGHLSLQLREGFRPSASYFRTAGVGFGAITRFIGLPSVPVRAETTATGGEYWATLPASRTVVARVERSIGAALWAHSLAEFEDDKARLLAANEELWRQRDAAFQSKMRAAQERWALTPRQIEVLSGLARGLSNKALTRELACSVKTVETHVTELLRRARAESRLALVATFWRDL